MDEFYKIREDLHKIPEIAFAEYKTSTYIRDFLSNLNIPYETLETSTLVSFNGISDEWIAFRADIDALPLTEENNVPYKSTHPGYMHACGHDGHTTNLLLFAKWIKNEIEKNGPFNKSILLIFQAAEEGGGGAQKIVESPLFLQKNIKNIFALHLSPDIPEGIISAKGGAMTFQNINLDITIHGKGCHGAQAYMGNDSILVAAKLIDAYQSIISRDIRALDPAILTIGSIHGGTVRNIIPNKVELLGTVRLLSKELTSLVLKRLIEINEGFEKSYNIKINTKAVPFYPPVNNSPHLFEILQNVVTSTVQEGEPLSASEDFSLYIEKNIPGLMFLLGTKNEEKNFTFPLHNSKFDFDPSILKNGFNAFRELLIYLDNQD
jgi:amidohydrolase